MRIRPGDSLLIAGLVRENDNFDKTGPGINMPIIPISRSARTANSELVFLLRPRVIVFTADGAAQRPGADAVRGLPMKVPVAEIKTLAVSPAEAPVVPPLPEPAPAPVVSAVPVPVLPPEPLPAPIQPLAPSPAPAPLPLTPAPADVPAAPPVARQPVPVETVPLAPAPQKAASATSDPSVIIDYNVLQGH